METSTEVIFPARNPMAQAISRRWGRMYQANAVVRFIDDFWYERDRIASMAVCMVGELAIDAAGIILLPGVIPKVAVLAAGRLFGVSNEFHTLYLAVKHRNYAIFNQTQTWVRMGNGVITRAPGFVMERAELEERRQLPLQKRFVAWAWDFSKAYFTESKRMPAFVIGVAGAAITYVFGNIFDLPVWVMLIGSWGPVLLPAIPEARNAIRAIIHRDVKIFSKPQMQTAKEDPVRGRSLELAGTEPALPAPHTVTGKAWVRRGSTPHRLVRRGVLLPAAKPSVNELWKARMRTPSANELS